MEEISGEKLVDNLISKLVVLCLHHESRVECVGWIDDFVNKFFFGRSFSILDAASNLTLPDEPYQISILLFNYYRNNWYIRTFEELSLMKLKQIKESSFQVDEVTLISPKNDIGPIIEVIFNKQKYRIGCNRMTDIYQTIIFEEINHVIANDNLLKRSYLFIKAWFYYELHRFSTLAQAGNYSFSLIFIDFSFSICTFIYNFNNQLFNEPNVSHQFYQTVTYTICVHTQIFVH